VAIGTGLNLRDYPPEAVLTGVEWSPRMLEQARARAEGLGHEVDLHHGDAEALPFADATFDAVVCTYSLCAIPMSTGP
jgi:ubiquinone/menaquinone biosynthesis C-methylase UbiE